MLVLDSTAATHWREEAAKATAIASRRSALEHEIWSNTVSVSDDAGRDTSNLLAQLGRPLSCQQVIAKLKLVNPRLIFEVSVKYPSLTGIYFPKWERDATGGWVERKVFICGMESGIMPEFSVLHKTKKRVANPDLLGRAVPRDAVQWKEVETFAAETRGWRTVLLRLLHLNLITRLDVEKHFGWNPSQDSAKWGGQVKESIHVR